MEQRNITGNEPAMPHGAWGQQTGTGLTIRQHFAAMAMQGILSANSKETWGNIDIPVPAHIAALSKQFADALIAELNKNV